MNPQIIYLDTNVFIAIAEMRHLAMRDFIERASGLGNQLFTSEITLAELLVRPIQEGDQDLALAYERLLVTGPLMTVVPVGRKILRESAGIRAKFGNKLPDAIHVATAAEQNCGVLVSSDRRLKLPPDIQQISVRNIAGWIGDE